MNNISDMLIAFCPFLPKRAKMKYRYLVTHSPYRFTANKTEAEEMKRCLKKYGLYYEEYKLYNCSGKDDVYKSSFISEINRYKLYEKLNGKAGSKLFGDKYKVYEKFKEFYDREVILIDGKDKFLDFVSRHSRVIIKPLGLSCGAGIRTCGESEAEDFYKSHDVKNKYICEELIHQRDGLSAFNKSSVNTVRMVTVISGGKTHIFYPFLRIGREGKEVDNGGAGGIIVPVDAKTGSLSPWGRDEAGRTFYEHPDSHIPFRGFILPEWSKAIELAGTLSAVMPEYWCIGWDIALSEKGWVMVEANLHGQFVGQQMDCVGKKRELERLAGNCNIDIAVY